MTSKLVVTRSCGVAGVGLEFVYGKCKRAAAIVIVHFPDVPATSTVVQLTVLTICLLAVVENLHKLSTNKIDDVDVVNSVWSFYFAPVLLFRCTREIVYYRAYSVYTEFHFCTVNCLL